MFPANLPAKRGRKKGTTMVHVNERRIDVMRLLLKGKSRHDIIEEIRDKHGVGDQTITNDLIDCHRELKEQYATKLSHLVALNHAKLDRLFEQWDTVDVNAQIKILDIQNKMANVYKPDTAVQVNNLNVNLDNLTVEELKDLLGKNETN
jgi:hypothetical protein